MRKEKILIAAIRSWNVKNAVIFKLKYGREYEIKVISRVDQLNEDFLRAFNPRYIFFPHWSWLIPNAIHSRYECVVFHMTDLPFGRGGSPVQNLILRGKKNTVISALRVTDGLDAGPIYFKVALDLRGSAENILKKASGLIYRKMIPHFLKYRPLPVAQRGRAVSFSRRKPSQSMIPGNADVNEFYDFIRMLDAEGYPPAFLETAKVRLEFSKAKIKDGRLTAVVNIRKKGESA